MPRLCPALAWPAGPVRPHRPKCLHTFGTHTDTQTHTPCAPPWPGPQEGSAKQQELAQLEALLARLEAQLATVERQLEEKEACVDGLISVSGLISDDGEVAIHSPAHPGKTGATEASQ